MLFQAHELFRDTGEATGRVETYDAVSLDEAMFLLLYARRLSNSWWRKESGYSICLGNTCWVLAFPGDSLACPRCGVGNAGICTCEF